MILVNDKQVEFTKFPDGTTSFRFSPHLPPQMFAQPMESPIFSITWKYDNDEECILLWYLTNHIRENNQRPIIRLSLPYIPNARMDRVKNADEVFTLKWFAEFINAFGQTQFVQANDGKVVVNMFAQSNYGYDGKLYTDYTAFQSCLKRIKLTVPAGETIAMPFKIGCGLGGGDWNVILGLIQKELSDKYTVELWRKEV